MSRRFIVVLVLASLGLGGVLFVDFISPPAPPAAKKPSSSTVAGSSVNASPSSSSLAALFATSSALAATTSTPTLTWSPAKLTLTLWPGYSKTIQATVTAQASVKSTAARVVPALAPFVSVAPSTVPTLSKGSKQTFTLAFAVPTSAPPQAITGTLHLDIGSTTIAQPLPVVVQLGLPLAAPGGLTLRYPPDWVVRSEDGGVTLTNLADRSLFNPDAGTGDFPFFHVRILGHPPGNPANPGMLPIDQWFDQYFSEGFATPPVKTLIQVAGRSAIRIRAVEGLGPSVHVYVPNGTNVIELIFSPGSSFDASYETILQSASF
jgi:hypothetical protein